MTTKPKTVRQLPLGHMRVDLDNHGGVLIDLYESEFDITERGRDQCREILARYARRPSRYSASANLVWITSIRREDRKRCADELAAVIRANLEPFWPRLLAQPDEESRP